ncbi:MAG: adenosylmethionine decarboxylase [Myxococcota bacterium]
MDTIGRHLIAEFYDCASETLNDHDLIQREMIAAADSIGATVVGHTFHKFSPQGVSGSVVIAESHLSIHTWPENGYVSVDIYTCGGLNPRDGFEHLARALGATSYRVQEILRGLPSDLGGQVLQPDDVQVITTMTDVVQVEKQVEKKALAS